CTVNSTEPERPSAPETTPLPACCRSTVVASFVFHSSLTFSPADTRVGVAEKSSIRGAGGMASGGFGAGVQPTPTASAPARAIHIARMVRSFFETGVKCMVGFLAGLVGGREAPRVVAEGARLVDGERQGFLAVRTLDPHRGAGAVAVVGGAAAHHRRV